jgi:putative ABC transport system substrate-binding protein
MNRRGFMTLLGGAAAWPIAASGQQQAMPAIGFLHSGMPEGYAPYVDTFRSGLAELNFVEGRNLAIEFRWAHDDTARLPAFAADLVQRRVALIVVPSGAEGAVAAKASTTTIPIVFGGGGDPVKLGLVASLNRPGGNATGLVQFGDALITKRLELLRELVPTASVIGVLASASGRATESQVTSVETAARGIGQQLRILRRA